MRKRLSALLLLLLLALTGCASWGGTPTQQGPQRYEASFLDLFDTVTVVIGYAESEEDFAALAQEIHDELEVYHRLYDIYNDYEGLVNLKTVNDRAGQPVQVDRRIMDLLVLAREMYDATGGQVNVAMGSVLRLWHDAREAALSDPSGAAIPAEEEIAGALEHISFDTVVLDEENSTVCLTDPEQSLDVGALAKGYAAEQVARGLEEDVLISVGGNVRASGPRADGTPWVVGVQDPDGGETYLQTLNLSQGSLVTSGDYQRYFTVDGVRYHHIIDPSTGYPARRYRAVTILCEDSGIADGLSTALFLMGQEEGKALLDQYGADALWILPDGTMDATEGFAQAVRTTNER